MSGKRPRPLSKRHLIQPTNTSITMDSRSTQRACLSCSSSYTPTRGVRRTKSRSRRSNSSSFRLVLLRTPDFKMSEGHTVPSGVFAGLFAAAEKVSVPKPRGRFADCLIWQINSFTAVGEHHMDFKDLLTKQGFDLDKVMVLRHRPTEPKAGAGVAADTGDVHTHDHDT